MGYAALTYIGNTCNNHTMHCLPSATLKDLSRHVSRPLISTNRDISSLLYNNTLLFNYTKLFPFIAFFVFDSTGVGGDGLSDNAHPIVL